MKKTKLILLFMITVFFLAGCLAGILSDVKSIVDMTPKEKATLFNKLYVAQYDDYIQMAASGTLSEDQKQIMRTKKKVLVKIQPLLLDYSNFVAMGLKPTPALEATIIDLLNQLGAKVG